MFLILSKFARNIPIDYGSVTDYVWIVYVAPENVYSRCLFSPFCYRRLKTEKNQEEEIMTYLSKRGQRRYLRQYHTRQKEIDREEEWRVVTFDGFT